MRVSGRDRRRNRRLGTHPENRPLSYARVTTAVIMVAAFLWYLLHLLSTVSYGCRDIYNWWFQREETGLATLQWSSLFAVTLALWFCVLIVRPKLERVPLWIRFFQGKMIFWMVVISVFQWGLFRPQSDEGRIYAWVQENAPEWPVINWVFSIRSMPFYEYEESYSFIDIDYEDPLFDEAQELEAEYARTFSANFIPRWMGMYRGELECEASARIDAAWERAYDAYITQWFEENPPAETEPSIWDTPIEPDPVSPGLPPREREL